MLAQSFKTAEELGLTENQRDALAKTLVLLETGKLVHTPIGAFGSDFQLGRVFTGHFNMGSWNRIEKCGTVCCIGGTADLISNGKTHFSDTKLLSGELFELFYPTKFIGRLDTITAEQAATALRSYLTTGKANWAVVSK